MRSQLTHEYVQKSTSTTRPRRAAAVSGSELSQTPAPSSADSALSSGVGGHGRAAVNALILPENEQPVDDVDAQEEDRQRPPRVGTPDGEQGAYRAEGGTDDPDDPAVGVAGEQREAHRELDDPEHDHDPAHRVEVGEDVARVVYEDVRAVQSADPVDDVERSRDQQQHCRECGSACTSHAVPPWVMCLVSRRIATNVRRPESDRLIRVG